MIAHGSLVVFVLPHASKLRWGPHAVNGSPWRAGPAVLAAVLLSSLGPFSVVKHAEAQEAVGAEVRVIVDHRGWQLVGDLRLPAAAGRIPAVLMLNQAAGDRSAYAGLARHLADRGIASLRLDLRGHGESINLGRFVPGQQPRSPLIWDSEVDVIAAHEFLSLHARIDADRIAMVGASYSGEEMAEAGRISGYAQAYVALSPGSFSEESIRGIDASGVPWLFVVSRDERFLREITAAVQEQSQTVRLEIVPGSEHASNLLAAHPDIAERIAIWLARHLRGPG